MSSSQTKPEFSLKFSLMNYTNLWLIVGLTALLLAIFVNWLSTPPPHETIPSMSASYWTQSGSIFIGCLVGMGFCMFIYNGNGILEFALNKVAGFLAIVVALFPTLQESASNGCLPPPFWAQTVAGYIFHNEKACENVSSVHSSSAIVFFLLLTVIMFIYLLRTDREKSHWLVYYGFRVGFITMLAGLVILVFAAFATETIHPIRMVGKDLFGLQNPIYWGERIFLFGFGIGWFTAGSHNLVRTGYTYLQNKVRGTAEEHPVG